MLKLAPLAALVACVLLCLPTRPGLDAFAQALEAFLR